VLRDTEHSRGTACYSAPELLIERKFNKKTDIWALGCVLFEVCTGKKAFTSEWATISYARQTPVPLPIFPFEPGVTAGTKTNQINALTSWMLDAKPEERWNVNTVCRIIRSLIRGLPGDPNSPIPSTKYQSHSATDDLSKYYWTTEDLIGTESPIWTCISPRIDQIIPPSVPYDGLDALIKRRKRLTVIRAEDDPATIWSHLYLAYTYYHHPSQTEAGRALVSLGVPLITLSRFSDKNLHDRIYASLMSAFAWFSTEQGSPIEPQQIFSQLIHFRRPIKPTDEEAKDLYAGFAQSKLLDNEWYEQHNALEYLSGYHYTVSRASLPLPVRYLHLLLPRARWVDSSDPGHSFWCEATIQLASAVSKSQRLFGPELESRLTTQLAIQSNLVQISSAYVGDSIWTKILENFPRQLELLGPANQDLKSLVLAFKSRSPTIKTETASVRKMRELLSALNLL
jgi:serine/threonine protein kinase